MPWAAGELRALAAVNATAVLLLGAAWERAGTTATLDGQITWLNVGVAALVLSAGAHGATIFVGRRAIGRRRAQLLPDPVVTTEPIGASSVGETWIWVAGTRRAHRPACPLTQGKVVVAADPDLIREHSLLRCEVCG
jgi:hypothetical protein